MCTTTKESVTKNHIREELELVEYIHNKKILFSAILGDTSNPFFISWWDICNILQPNNPDSAGLKLINAFSSMCNDNFQDKSFDDIYNALENVTKLDVRDGQALALACVEMDGME